MTYLLSSLEEPRFSGLGVGDSLLGSESLGGDNEEGSFWVALFEGLGHIGTVNVGDEDHLEVTFAVALESLTGHNGSKVGSTDTNVNNGFNTLSGVTFPST